jgi:hypothetical protein
LPIVVFVKLERSGNVVNMAMFKVAAASHATLSNSAMVAVKHGKNAGAGKGSRGRFNFCQSRN